MTCNYEARKRGLFKLQLISEARRMCPEVVVVLGEDLTRFRAASKELYSFLTGHVWSKRSERLGFDEVWLDVTDMIDYNVDLVNQHDPSNSYFHLDKKDPTVGFAYDATALRGYQYQPSEEQDKSTTPNLVGADASDSSDGELRARLIAGSHLAQYLRLRLEEEKGYSATVGIAVNKLISKLVGNCHKPRAQTTLLPPLKATTTGVEGNVTTFLDGHDIGKVPGIGFKLSQKLREHVLGRQPAFSEDLVYGGTKEHVSVRDVRLFPSMGPTLLEEILGGPGAQKGIGTKVWCLLHGVDDSDVAKARSIPTQISLEDSYIRLDTIEEVQRELHSLSLNLVKRMHLDLTDTAADTNERHWLAIPHTLRLSTRPRPPVGPDGKRPRTFNRISRSGPMPTFILSRSDDENTAAARLASEALMPMFRKLHPEKSGWNLSLINVAATNMQETASRDGGSTGRDIGDMFKRQEEVLREWKVEDKDVPPGSVPSEEVNITEVLGEASLGSYRESLEHKPRESVLGSADASYSEAGTHVGSEDFLIPTQSTFVDPDDGWQSDGSQGPVYGESCPFCSAVMPAFAYEAHLRYHEMETD